MKPDAFLKKIADDNAVAPGTHELAAPLRPADIGRWKARHGGVKLPNDLLGFLKRTVFVSDRLKPSCTVVNPVYGIDYTSFCKR